MGGIYSQRRAREVLAPALEQALRDQAVDAVLLVPFCPVCHQKMALVARHLEAAGLPTLCIVSARDILEAVDPPRAVFVDYPIGHTAGKPNDPDDQYGIASRAMTLFATMEENGRAPGWVRWGQSGSDSGVA